MLIQQLFVDMIAARKGSDPIAKSLLVTLYSEAARVGKDRRNGDTTDEEVIATVKKFAANAEETARNLDEIHRDNSAQRRELAILESYLPSQMTDDQLTKAIHFIIQDLGVSGPRAMGQVMAELKLRHNGCYDGKLASTRVREALA